MSANPRPEEPDELCEIIKPFIRLAERVNHHHCVRRAKPVRFDQGRHGSMEELIPDAIDVSEAKPKAIAKIP